MAAKVELWNGTVHLSNQNGRPLCGSAKRTHISWIWATEKAITCQKCLAK